MARRRIAIVLAASLVGLALLWIAGFPGTESQSTAGDLAPRDPGLATRPPEAAPDAAPSPASPAPRPGAEAAADAQPAAPVGIRGRVVFQGTTPWCAVQIHCMPIPADAEAAPVTSADLQRRSAKGISVGAWVEPEDGFAYSYEGLRPGRYLVWVAMPAGGPVLGREEVEVAMESVTRDLQVAAFDLEGFVGVHVLGPDGAVPPDLSFRAGYRSPGRGTVEGTAMALARNDGLFLVPHYEMESLMAEGGTWWVEAISTALGSMRAEYRRGQPEEIVLRFAEPGTLEVALTGILEGVAERADLLITLRPAGSVRREGSVPHARVSADGRATIVAVQPGDYEALLVVGMTKTLACVPVTVRSGSNALPFPAPVLHTVTVLGAESGSFVTVFRRGALPWNDRCPADAEGRAVFDGIPEGDFTVRCGSRSRELHVPGTVEVKL